MINGTSIIRESKVTEKKISRWVVLKLLLKVGLFFALTLGAWGLILWGSFLIAFPLGLIVSGISLFFIASALNRVIEDKLYQLAEVYTEGVFPAGGKIADKPDNWAPDDWEGWEEKPMAESSLASLFKANRNLATGDPVYAEDIEPLETGDTVIIEHEVSENGRDDMVFEFEEAEAVSLDPVDKKIDDILQGGK
jgi:hypothetical protein